MRRSDREITDSKKIEAIIDACSCMRVGFYDGEEVYIVPLNFGYLLENGNYTFYFHGANAGRKFDLIQTCPNVGFEMDTNECIYSTKSQDPSLACFYTTRFQSVIGNGTASIVEDAEEKMRGLHALMDRLAKPRNWVFEEKLLQTVSVFKIEVEKLSCKEHL